MILTNKDLADWNNHPVTIAIFKEVKKEVDLLNSESVLCGTVDATAMKASYNDGKAAGAEAMLEAYEILEEEVG